MAQDLSPSPSTRPTPQAPRRVPPPCWTHDETVALIDSYREKWYSLRRGNLRASHWQEVADSVARRCRLATPSKTSVQCRHKIEKLRKRYRTDTQRALTMTTPNRFSSSWVYFRKMQAMERGSDVDSDENGDDDGNDDADEDDDDDEDGADDDDDDKINTHTRNLHHLTTNGGGGGFRVRHPGGLRPVPTVTGFAKPKNYGRVDENPNPSPHPNPSSNPRILNGSSWSRSGFGRSGGSGSKREMDPVAEMVSSIRLLGEGFVKMEQMKIDMAREMEQMRMEMEMKRTEMILESQQRIVEAFTKGFSGKKKVKRMPSPDS